MRSGDLTMPEEHTRIEVDSFADLLLCPDERSRGILEAEGVPGTIAVVGDVMADACFTFAPIARERSTCSSGWRFSREHTSLPRSTATRTSSSRGSATSSPDWPESKNP